MAAPATAKQAEKQPVPVVQSDALTHHEQQMLTELDVLCGKVFELCEEGGKLRKKFNRANVRNGCQQLMHALARLGSEKDRNAE